MQKIYIVMDLCAGGLSERIKEHGPFAEKVWLKGGWARLGWVVVG